MGKRGLTLPAVSALVAVAVLGFPAAAPAAEPAAGNLLVTNNFGNVIHEYTPAGTLVQSIPVPYPSAERPRTEYARDLLALGTSEILVFNGTFSPYLSVYDTRAGTWQHHTDPRWRTVSNGTYGGIAERDGFVYVTSDLRFSGDPSGFVRFDRSDWSTAVFHPDLHFIDLTIGHDGLLYGLHHSERSLSVFDPDTMEFLRFVNLAQPGVRGIAVDGEGRIFAASEDSLIYRFDASGALEATLASGAGFLGDFDLSATGQLAAGARSDDVVLTDTEFSAVRTFQTGDPDAPQGAFVAWVETPPNQRPDCSGAGATPRSASSSKHTFAQVSIGGVLDPDGDGVAIEITGVTQDEPVAGKRSGKLAPDARLGAAADAVLVRRERDQRGDGRVYRVAFTASDGNGGVCEGTATVGVPRHSGSPAVDSAPPGYDSFGGA